jgi:hypothetical protein
MTASCNAHRRLVAPVRCERNDTVIAARRTRAAARSVPDERRQSQEVIIMVKRLLLILALGATLAACSPSTGGSGAPSVAPVESVPAESMAPSPS